MAVWVSTHPKIKYFARNLQEAKEIMRSAGVKEATWLKLKETGYGGVTKSKHLSVRLLKKRKAKQKKKRKKKKRGKK